jgi:Helicase conserved C-terminal domain
MSKVKLGKWIKAERDYDKMIYLTEEDDTIKDRPKHLYTNLLAHQKTTVKAMLDLETRRFVRVKSLPKPTSYWNNTNAGPVKSLESPVIETTAGVLSEKLGSGKSFEMLALISLNPIPKAFSEITSMDFPLSDEVQGHSYSAANNKTAFKEAGFGLEIRKTYKTLFRQTVIFVSKSVLVQWTQYIQDYTDFKVMVIGDVRALRKLHQMVFAPTKESNRSSLYKYDIILVKNKTVSGKFDIPEIKGTYLEKNKIKPILTLFGEMFSNICFARVVLDDFDTINIPNTARVVPALFTWFISSTTKSSPSKRNMGRSHHDIRDMVTYSRPTYVESWENNDLFTHFNICNSDAFIDKSTNVGKIHFYSYKFKNPNESYIELLGTMGAADATNVMEMLNGDAVNTAAEAAGIKSTSVADIFEKILEDKWLKYKLNVEIANYIPDVQDNVAELPPLPDPEYAITQAGLNKLAANIRKCGPLGSIQSIVKYEQQSADDKIKELESENNSAKEENGKAVERVKSRLKEGDCPICCEEFADCEGVMIMKCCGQTFCTDCVKDTTGLHSVGNDVQGKCANCRAVISFQQMIMIDKEISLDSIISDNIDEEEEEEDLPDLADTSANDDDSSEEKPLTKFRCIIGIIKGKEYKDLRKNENVKIDKILIGANDLPEAKKEERKFLVFANFKETLDNLQKEMDEESVTYARLNGTSKQIAELVKRYKLPHTNPRSINVLLINAARYCAGLNLQNTTDVAFTHKVTEKSIESQLVGRAVRVGRTMNLNVHYILYHNEFGHLHNH